MTDTNIHHIKIKSGWSVFEKVITNFVPNDDLTDHILFEEWCGCAPKFDGTCLIHNALDGRTKYEKPLDVEG